MFGSIWRWTRQTLRSHETVPPLPAEPVVRKIVVPGSGGQPYPALAAILRSFAGDATPPDHVLLGDSVCERVSKHDADRRTLVEILAAGVAPRCLLALTRSAHHPAVYRLLLSALELQPRRPTTGILIAINPRCFSPQWDLNPDWQLDAETCALEDYRRRRRPELPEIPDVYADPEAHRRFEELPVRYELSDLSTIGAFRSVVRQVPGSDDEKARRTREIFIFHYAHRLTRDHRRLTALRDCVDLSRRLVTRATYYLTPINVEAGARHVGPGFLEVVRANAETVGRAIRDSGGDFHDWSGALPESCFFHEDLATEHLNETGRTRLAALIAATALR